VNGTTACVGLVELHNGGMTCQHQLYPAYLACPQCVSNTFGVGNFPGHRLFDAVRHEKEMRCMTLARRQTPEASANGSAQPLEACKFSAAHPNLVSFISQHAWEDGQSRVPGTVTFLFDGGQVKAALNDRDSGQGCFVSAKTFTSLLTVIESVLGGAPADWRVKEQPRNTSAGKRR
jgi:hypothetical protein